MRLNYRDDNNGGYICNDCQDATENEINGVYMVNVNENSERPCDICGNEDAGINGSR